MKVLRILSLFMSVLFLSSALAGAASVFEQPRKKQPKKAYDYEKSRYKSYRTLTDDEQRTYKFDEKGNPVLSPAKLKKKKAAAKKKSKPKPGADGAEAPAPAEDAAAVKSQPKGK
ncbi:MAG: hypothetical protein WC881_04615 [Elusimicrobiota bacterium]|jgi:hypothetical protein